MNFNGPQTIFLSLFVEKNYALPLRVLSALVNYFFKFEQDSRQLPLIFYKLLLIFVKNYSNSLEDIQKEALKHLLKKKPHATLSQEINAQFEKKSQAEILQMNRQKVETSMQIEE